MTEVTNDGPIKCKLCGEEVHHIGKHLTAAHPGETEATYSAKFPGEPLMSKKLEAAIAEKAQQRGKAQANITNMSAQVLPFAQPGAVVRKPMHEVFGLPLTDELRAPAKRGQTQGDPIMIEVRDRSCMTAAEIEAIPDIDDGYVFDPEILKDAVMAIQLNMNLLAWGMHGTGKTSLIEQICAYTNRPWLRVQHTATTEEAHIIGQMVVRDGATEFDYGPLAEAMINGWLYCGDEYDFAVAAVIAVYQPVLEGKPLYIKEAPPSMRLIKPHPAFRFVATGNTNGSGDDTGLYAGTNIGNAASYSRFGVTIQVPYPAKKVEIGMLRSRIGLTQDIAEKLRDFAESSREMYKAGELSLPISPRELLGAAKIGMIKGGQFRKGIELAYANRLDATQAESVSQTAQRLFG